MSLIMVGYGEYAEYRLTELPSEILEEVGKRYPLALSEQRSAEYDELAITVAVHAEIKRRSTGGQPARHVPSRRELAQLVVGKGFQQASKHCHPDGTGHHESQVRLSQVRDQLLEACADIPNDRPDDAIMIPPPVTRRPARPPAPHPFAGPVTDDDVPF